MSSMWGGWLLHEMGYRVRPGHRSLGRTIRRRTPSPQTPRCPGPSGRPSYTPSLTDSLDLIDSGWGPVRSRGPNRSDWRPGCVAVSGPL